MPYLVIDTCVLEKAQNLDYSALWILVKVGDNCKYKIVYDYEEEILSEYRKHLRSDLIKKMISDMVFKGKFVPRPKANIDLRAFDAADLKFVQTAASVPNCYIISVNSDYNKIKELLQKDSRLRNIKVFTPEEAKAILC